MTPLKKLTRFLFHTVLYFVIGSFFLTGFLRLGMLVFSRNKTYMADAAPNAQIALVLGAGLNRDGSPGVVLRDRVRRASELYFSGKVDKLLMSGDNSSIYYNEPRAMKDFALSLGVPEDDIVLDFAGRRTYDSCYRALEIFKVDSVIVVTQAFHLPRAIFICSALGLQTDGVTADDSNYPLRSYTFWWTREIIATIKAYWDVYIIPPALILGDSEPIFP